MIEILTDTLYAFGLILVLFNMVFSIVVTVVDNIIQFVFVYLYLIGIVYSANKVHKKHLKQEIKTNLK